MNAEPRIYRIIRFRFNARPRTVKKNVTLREAQKHCANPATSYRTPDGYGSWFDGYDYMPGCAPKKKIT